MMIFGLFGKKKEETPAKPVWPFKEPHVSEDRVRQAAQMGVRQLRLEAKAGEPHFPPAIENAAKTPDQMKALRRVWMEEVSAEVQKRAARPKIGGQ